MLLRRRGLGAARSGLCEVARSARRRAYHSYEHAPADVYHPAERAILSSAMTHVPDLGFTLAAIQRGARETGHLEVTHNLFPGGAFDLVRFHLETERLALAGLPPARDDETARDGPSSAKTAALARLCRARLRANVPYLAHLQDALAVMALPGNLAASLGALHDLSDEMLHLAGDDSADMRWYARRLTLSAVYASTELYMTQDDSPDFRQTWAFLDRRLADVHGVGSGLSEVTGFVGFQLWQAKNILASKGFKI